MQLTLSIRTGSGVPEHDVAPKSFNQFPVIIGRSTSCHFVLSDHSRYISSNHAVVSEDDGTLYLEDTSANGVYVNGSNEPIGRGQSTQLKDGDTIAIGDYSLEAHISSQAVNAADPFAFEKQTPPPETHYDPFEGSELDWTPESGKNNDWANDTSPEHSQLNGNWANWTGLNESNEKNQPKSPAAQQHIATDESDPWFDIANKKPESGVKSNQARNNKLYDPNRARTPVPARKPRQRPQRSVADNRSVGNKQPPPRSSTEQNSERALKCFFDAAQLEQKNFADQSPEALMTQTGKLLNLAIDGMMMLLQSRAEIKNAIRSDVTQLNRIDNNPLKFSYSAQDALKKLLSEDNGGGYLDSERAMTQAIEDLKIHQVALLEGMKSAVKAILLDFNPDKLANALEKKHPIAANIPITRDAKLWQLYQEHYSDIKEDAVNNFGEMFGVEFRKAYEQRIKDQNKH